MAGMSGRPITEQRIMDAVNVFISELVDDPPENVIYEYNPGMRCYEVTFGTTEAGTRGYTAYIEKALPEDDGLRITIVEFLHEKFGIESDIVLEWL
ncbi:MAG: hypothetical protein F4X65_07575 [Chloroflexi bacterium]|nr:hypothetical protein [Chloroflexota bacterium]